MFHPYQMAPAYAFWRNGVAALEGEDFSHLFKPKFGLSPSDLFATAGSCFAQHIGRILLDSGCGVLDAEPAPRHLEPNVAKAYGYGIYSGRYGNIYTARQMRELLEEILSDPPLPTICWPMNLRWVDALRPSIEPEGLSSAYEVVIHRNEHLTALRTQLPQCSVFVFTLGMTEAWQDRETGRTLPVCPGVIGGAFSDATCAFVDFRYPSLMEDLTRIRDLLHIFNSEMRLLLTVSPVPLSATASGRHVLTASSRAKATLRAAAEDFADRHADVDYFPSFEIVTSPASRSPCFEPNLRHVRAETVAKVMSVFTQAYALGTTSPSNVAEAPLRATFKVKDPEAALICEEALLNAFARK